MSKGTRVKGEGKNPDPGRRALLASLPALLAAPRAFARSAGRETPVPHEPSLVAAFPPVVPGYPLRFPLDEGSHPAFRTEWWYVTGWLANAAREPSGFQITFFRTRPVIRDANPSAFTPRQIMVAHAALSEPRHGRLRSDQRVARAVFDLAGARRGQTDVWLDDWWLRQDGAGYKAHVAARDFRFDFTVAPTQPPLLEGENGFSRKGPEPESASYYYSLPQLSLSGTVARSRSIEPVTGTAWLDHEWSSSYLDREAVGWDWLGINFADGGALMAFRMRDRRGGSRWAGGTYRAPDLSTRVLEATDLVFTPRRYWRSPRTGVGYPVSWVIAAAALEIDIEPLMDDQENDVRLTTGTIYWEGAVRALRGGKRIGQGYLELTGYWKPMHF